MTRPMSQFAMRDGNRRLKLSCRSFRQPLTTSYPSSIFSRRAPDVGRVVLQVAVHRNDDLASGVVESGGHRRRLTVVPTQLDELQTRVAGRKARESIVRLVSAAVVDDDDLVGAAELVEGASQRVVERPDVLLLVVHRDHD